MKINATLADKKVSIKLSNLPYPINQYVYVFTEDYLGGPDYHALLLHHIQRAFESAVSSIREDAYNEGWKDKASKKRKKTKFNACFNGTTVGW